MSNPIQLIWPDNAALALAAAHHFTIAANTAISSRGKFIVALSGGSTPKLLFETLATPAFAQNIEWKNVYIFWSDERFVPHTSDDSNYKMAKTSLLDFIKIPKKNIYAIPVKGKPEDCANAYEASVSAITDGTNIFDLILLGMGDDGHTASLFPGTDILQERRKMVKEVWVESKQTWRISFTYPLINKAREVMFLVSGEAKAPVVSQIFNKKTNMPTYPVQGVQPKKGLAIWMLDTAAAGK